MPQPPDARWLAEQIARNRSTEGCAEPFASHRQRVMELLVAAASPGRPLALLGAGNCNDVDLPELLPHFSEVHLVDWDAEALARAVDRQGVADDRRIVLHGGVDLTGLTEFWSHPGPPSAEQLAAAVDAAQHADWPLPRATFGCVASLCVLSQLIDMAVQWLGPSHPLRGNLIEALRLRHLQRLVECLAPGGTGLLLSDFMSSSTAPALLDATESELPKVVAQHLSRGNFFQGLHPGVVWQLVSGDSWFRERVDCSNPTPPWNWNLGNRVYAVSALRFNRHA
jgi:hypothetical protein